MRTKQVYSTLICGPILLAFMAIIVVGFSTGFVQHKKAEVSSNKENMSTEINFFPGEENDSEIDVPAFILQPGFAFNCLVLLSFQSFVVYFIRSKDFLSSSKVPLFLSLHALRI